MKKFDIAIIGGDKRTASMASVFAQKGYSVICFGISKIPTHDTVCLATTLKEAVTKTSVLICGTPLERDGCLYFEEQPIKIPLTELQRLLRKNHKLFGGVIPADFKSVCENRQIACFDFMLEESLVYANAVYTAEGSIAEALLHKSTQLHQSKTLVLGYGRCGKVLADKLRGLSACVTVCSSQTQELSMAEALGYPTLQLSDLSDDISSFEYIFNTIPATVLDEACLTNTDKDALIIDIASHRIGVDYKAADRLRRDVLFCPGLPGKYASTSCAEQLADYVVKKIEKL